MKKFWRNNGLSVTLFLLFAVILAGQAMAGHREYNKDQQEHGRSTSTFTEYLRTPHFIEATTENWESEFLQMAAYVFFTVFLYQKGSAESKDPERKEPVDREPDPNRKNAPWPVRRGGIVLVLYKRSLSLSLLMLFLVSLVLHAIGGARHYNAEQLLHGQGEAVTAAQYVTTSRFWFESLQNWQSEFLAVFAIVVLSVFLRQQGSPESKPVDAAHHDTGE